MEVLEHATIENCFIPDDRKLLTPPPVDVPWEDLMGITFKNSSIFASFMSSCKWLLFRGVKCLLWVASV